MISENKLYLGRKPLSGFYTLQIVTVAGVYAHLVADVAEQGNTDFSAGLHCGGLEGVGGGVALDAGFGVCDFKYHIGSSQVRIVSEAA